MAAHSPAFAKTRDLLLELEEPERARLAQLFGAMNEPKKPLGPAVRETLRSIAELDDQDLEEACRLAYGACEPVGSDAARPWAPDCALR